MSVGKGLFVMLHAKKTPFKHPILLQTYYSTRGDWK